jgi:hypothetical protein
VSGGHTGGCGSAAGAITTYVKGCHSSCVVYFVLFGPSACVRTEDGNLKRKGERERERESYA